MHPLEFIRGLLGTKVSIVLRDREEVTGVLKMFDEHLNIIIRPVVSEGPAKELLFLRSDSILTIGE
ncbi:hypothetical protein NECID01_1451 [Nematocida sp. AWRm77]|nr:hypothetical protein NECID01_1451 [Nematocida sp. AWRm77]